MPRLVRGGKWVYGWVIVSPGPALLPAITFWLLGGLSDVHPIRNEVPSLRDHPFDFSQTQCYTWHNAQKYERLS